MSEWWHFFSRNKTKLWNALYILSFSFFLAKCLNLILASQFLPIELAKESDSRSGVRPEIQAKADLSRILSRNLFDSNASGRRVMPKEPEVNSDELRPSSINAELLGTVVFLDSRYSVALVRDRTNNTTKYYGTGDELLGTTMMKIERFRVIIQRDGRLETLELQAAKSKMPEPSRPSVSALTPSSTDVKFEEIGPGKYLIPERTINELMGNLPQIMRDARAVPNIGPDNRIDGFKLLEIKPNSIFDKLGLQNGDIVRRVNQEDLNSVEKGMSLFTALRNEKTISIDIDRAGSRLNYTYEIR